MNIGVFTIAWAVMVCATAILMIYKRVATNHEDDSVHMMDYEAGLVQQQESAAKRIAALERWTTVLLALTAVAGVALGGLYLYQGWMEASTIKY